MNLDEAVATYFMSDSKCGVAGALPQLKLYNVQILPVTKLITPLTISSKNTLWSSRLTPLEFTFTVRPHLSGKDTVWCSKLTPLEFTFTVRLRISSRLTLLEFTFTVRWHISSKFGTSRVHFCNDLVNWHLWCLFLQWDHIYLVNMSPS